MKFFLFINIFTLTHALYQNRDLDTDSIQIISNFTDDSTAFVLSTVSQSLYTQTQSRINGIKINAIKQKCPHQYLHIINHGQSILHNSYNPDLLLHEDNFVMHDTKDSILGILNQKRQCIQALLMAKNLISNRLKSISIALPAFSTARTDQCGIGLYDGTDIGITKSIQKYFASIRLLVNAGFIKRIKIESAGDTYCSLHPDVERNLYAFLSTLQVPEMHFSILLRNYAAFNEFALKGAFSRNLAFQDHDSAFILPVTTEVLRIHYANPQLTNSHLPNIKLIDVMSDRLTDLTTHRPQLESIIIDYIRYDHSFFETICSPNSWRIKELSLIFQTTNIYTTKLKNCLMALKPTLHKLTFYAYGSLIHFWNDFAHEFLQNNLVLKELTLDLGNPDLHDEEENFLQTYYDGLQLDKLDISIEGKVGLIHSIQTFVSTHSSLKSVTFTSNILDDVLSYLPQLFRGIQNNLSIQDIGLTFEVRVEVSNVDRLMNDFADMLRVFEGRDLRVNGVAVEIVIRDFSINQSEYFSCHREYQDDECVMIFAPLELKNNVV